MIEPMITQNKTVRAAWTIARRRKPAHKQPMIFMVLPFLDMKKPPLQRGTEAKNGDPKATMLKEVWPKAVDGQKVRVASAKAASVAAISVASVLLSSGTKRTNPNPSSDRIKANSNQS